jgi:aminoglycoside phosphotransferase (APT) family kinase protein
MSITLEERCRKLITALELGAGNNLVSITPLTGGVSSDIALVNLGTRKVCVKFALDQLKVVEEWHANVDRNQAEYLWLQFVQTIAPQSTPALYGSSAELNGFAMEYVEGDEVYLWKAALLQGQPDRNEAAKVGAVLGLIHRASATSEPLRKMFQNQEDFYDLRLEPYLVFTATRHPELGSNIHVLVDMLKHHQPVLIHGDVSPKNIMFRQGEPIFLDAECATMGDPSFDISFCLNHLILKAFHMENSRTTLLASVKKFWAAYRREITWEETVALERRVCALLPGLMLARVDGKSPVEYLKASEQTQVRSLAIALILKPVESLDRLVDHLSRNLER